nr:reverse transcriptase domain-containing protein [Tanacetum cinerariifolium]
MHTRSSGPVIEPSTNPRKRRNKKCSQQQVDPTIVENLVDTMADHRTMVELLQAPTEGYRDAIVIPAILVENFELKHADQDSLNAASDGNLLTKDALTLIENKSKVRTSQNRPVIAKVSTNTSTSSLSPDVVSLTDAIKALLLKNTTPPLAFVKTVEKSCVTCGGPHPYYQCLATDGKTFPGYQDNIQAYVSAVVVKYNQGNARHRPPSSLPSNIVANPKGDLKVITTQSGKFHFSADFVVVDYVVDPRVTLILGRPFLRMARALIDVYGEELTLRVSDEAITFKVGNTSRYSYNHAESINQIDVIDVACEEYSQEVLGFSGNYKSGNLTPTSEPIIAKSSPSLTPFNGGDFILEEIEAYLASDSVPPRIDEANFDPEEDICLVEKFLYDNSSPRPSEDLNSKIFDAIIESFSASSILVEDNDYIMEEIDIFLAPDDSIPPRIKNDDYDLEGDNLFLKELLNNNSLPENESFHFDRYCVPSSPRPLEKPLDDDGIYFDIEHDMGVFTAKVLNPGILASKRRNLLTFYLSGALKLSRSFIIFLKAR